MLDNKSESYREGPGEEGGRVERGGQLVKALLILTPASAQVQPLNTRRAGLNGSDGEGLSLGSGGWQLCQGQPAAAASGELRAQAEAETRGRISRCAGLE